MSRTMRADSTEAFRVIVTICAIGTIIPERSQTFGPFGNRQTANAAAKRETTNYHGDPMPSRTYRIQRTATDWQDIE